MYTEPEATTVEAPPCDACGKPASNGFLTQINPEGGYGRPRLLSCDACVRLHFMDRVLEHWPDWPGKDA